MKRKIGIPEKSTVASAGGSSSGIASARPSSSTAHKKPPGVPRGFQNARRPLKLLGPLGIPGW